MQGQLWMNESILYLSAALEPLADELDALLQDEMAAAENPFVPATIVVPSADVRTWLQLFLARRQNVAINLRIQYLENALWEILNELTDLPDQPPVERLEHENYRLLILAILLEEADEPDLKPVREYLRNRDLTKREFCRRIWDLSDRLARLIRDYEYHRQTEFIQKWVAGELALNLDAGTQALERCERALFNRIIDMRTGFRARLSEKQGRAFKTLPQYAQEVMEGPLRDESLLPAHLRLRPVHFFAVSQISPYHIRLLRWLGSRLPLRIYHVNPLVTRLDAAACRGGKALKTLRQTAVRFASGTGKVNNAPGDELLHCWASAGAGTFSRMSNLLSAEKGAALFATELLPAAAKHPKTVLQRLQSDLAISASSPEKFAQDTSLQIAACPGIFREVETAYHSIIYNLLHDADLRLTDIAVLVPSMDLYRPVIQTIFDRDIHNPLTGGRIPSPVAYNLRDCAASEMSVFAQAILAMFDAALEGFPRTRVLDVLTNPCFLEKLKVAPEQAAVWLNWAERLAVYHGWDRQDKRESGYNDSRQYSWRLALQRLRLGRIMETVPANPDVPVSAYKGVVPFADIESGDAERLDIFCRAVEELLPRLARFRGQAASATDWIGRIRDVIDDFLEIPEDREDEGLIRSGLLRSLDLLRTIDAVKNEKLDVSLPLVREFIASQLGDLGAGGTTGQFGGVTVAALKSARSIPYKIVYVLGLGEGLFPAPEASSPFDLRETKPVDGDIRPADLERLQFLEVLAAARKKLYLFHSCKELQKDQDLYPCAVINKLIEYVETNVLPPGQSFKIAAIPLHAHDSKNLAEVPKDSTIDLFLNYGHWERILALKGALASGHLDGNCAAEIEKLGSAARAELLKTTPPVNDDAREAARVAIRDLSFYLSNPAQAALNRHLRLRDEDEYEPRDDEPFYTDNDESRKFVETILRRYVARAAGGSPPDYEDEFTKAYEDRRQQGLAPEGVFAAADQSRIRAELRQRILGANEPLADFVRAKGDAKFFGPVQIGESRVPIGARTFFPALRIQTKTGHEVLLSAAWDLAWCDAKTLDLSSIKHGIGKDKVSETKLSWLLFDPVLFYLALLAGEEKNADGVASSEWAGDRALRVMVAHDDGAARFDYAEISPARAREYLTNLIEDYLTPECFDHLPFNTIRDEKELREAFECEEGVDQTELRKCYREKLQDAINEKPAYENRETKIRTLELLDLQVPEDAFEKIRRRFHLLDMGPRANRANEVVEKQEWPATKMKTKGD